jgi:DNA-binding MarR family transcriptional regulator
MVKEMPAARKHWRTRLKRHIKGIYEVEGEECIRLDGALDAFTKWLAEWRTHALRRGDLEPEQYRMLLALEGQSGLRISSVAERLLLSEPQAGRQMKAMEQRGWVVVARGEDSREKRVALTKAGEEMLAQCKQQLLYLMLRILRIFPPASRNKILPALEELNRGVHEKWIMDLDDYKSVGGKPLLVPGEKRGRRRTRVVRRGRGVAPLSGPAPVEVNS